MLSTDAELATIKPLVDKGVNPVDLYKLGLNLIISTITNPYISNASLQWVELKLYDDIKNSIILINKRKYTQVADKLMEISKVLKLRSVLLSNRLTSETDSLETMSVGFEKYAEILSKFDTLNNITRRSMLKGMKNDLKIIKEYLKPIETINDSDPLESGSYFEFSELLEEPGMKFVNNPEIKQAVILDRSLAQDWVK